MRRLLRRLDRAALGVVMAAAASLLERRLKARRRRSGRRVSDA
jgi:hypothetical protein